MSTQDEHPWIYLCELAYCSPDFDVVYHFPANQAVAWLQQRLREHGHNVQREDIFDAYNAWPPKEGRR